MTDLRFGVLAPLCNLFNGRSYELRCQYRSVDTLILFFTDKQRLSMAPMQNFYGLHRYCFLSF